jgi:long-chain acyl-CoA synthetase
MARTTILEYLDNFRRHAREAAYVHRRGYRTQRWTYGDVLNVANQFARELESRSIGKGDKVVIWGDNCAEWIAAFFGCLLRGAIVVPVDKIAAPDFAQRIAEQVGSASVRRTIKFPASLPCRSKPCARILNGTPMRRSSHLR